MAPPSDDDAKTPHPALVHPTIERRVGSQKTISEPRAGLSTEWKTRITKVAVVGRSNSETGDACVVLIYPPGPDMGKRFMLTRDEVVLGRGADCDIQVDRDSVSRRHARISRTGTSWFVADLESTNGTYVNDVAVSRTDLRDSDFLKIGAAIFKFMSGSGIEASYHEEIYRMTIVDALTNAYNKRYLFECLEREIERATQYRRALSLVLVDIDHFRAINDKHGHLTGDFVLRELAHRALEYLGGSSEKCFARYGGEQFALVLPECELAQARTIAEDIRRLIADKPFEYEGDTFPVTVSLGVATSELSDALDVASFIKTADENLFRAKREGRNRVIAGAGEWGRWKADPGFQGKLADKGAVVAISLLGRDQLLATPGRAAQIDDLEGLLYARLKQRPKVDLMFGGIEGGAKLLVGLNGRNAADRLRTACYEAMRACTDERPDAPFALGSAVIVTGDHAVAEAVAVLDEEIRTLENGNYLPQPVAVAVRAIGTLAPARAKLVLEAAETLLQWLALTAAADLLSENDGDKTRAALRRNLTGGVTMGRWNELLVTALKELDDANSAHKTAWTACFGDRSARTELFAWFNSVVELRNAFAHGATASDEHVARKIVDDIAPRLLRHVKQTLRPVLGLVPAEVELVGFEGDLQSYRMTRLIGDGGAASVLRYSRRRMNPGLWLCDTLADRAVAMEPFFVRDTCPKCGARELFLLTRLDVLEFRSPATNHVLRSVGDSVAVARDRLGL